MRKFSLTALLLCAVFCTSCTAENAENITTTEEITTTVSLAEETVKPSLYNIAKSYKETLDNEEAPFTVSSIYYADGYDFNNDGKEEHILAYNLYSQFQLLVLDGSTCDVLIEERIMMNLVPTKTACEVYSDGNGRLALNFVSWEQKSASSAITETVQIIADSESYMFEAVYDENTEEFIHAYDKYSSYEEYMEKRNEPLESYHFINDLFWYEYLKSETENTVIAETTATEEATAAPEKIELKEFDFDNIEYIPVEEYTGIDFLTEEQQRSFWLATFVYEVFMLDGSEFFRLNKIEYETYSQRLIYTSPLNCYGTGFTDDSVWNEISTVFSGNILFEITQHKIASSDDFEFAIWDGARGASADFDYHLEFAPVEITDEKVTFQITARYADPDNREEKSYYTYDYEMVYDSGNWIMTKFELWK